MLDRLLKFEEHLVRLEARLLVVLVLLMLALATYNVFYRNVLVPIQVRLITAPADAEAPSAAEHPPAEPAPAEPADPAAGFGGGFVDEVVGETGGFGGDFDAPPAPDPSAGFGGDFDEPAAPPAAPPAADPSAGFGGDFDEPAASPAAPPAADPSAGFGGDFDEPAAQPAAPPAADPSAGFGGDFDEPTPAADPSAGFGGDFGDQPEPAGHGDSAEVRPAAALVVDSAPVPEREVPAFAKFVDAVKFEWIDVLLRQLVLIVGFLGAMMATRRRKHITIDALSKLLPNHVLHWVHVFTNAISIVVCVLLAKAGADLVAISLEYPKELMAWADEWHFQLAFPLGFGLLVLHFAIRLIESLHYATGKAEPPPGYLEQGGAA